MLKPQAANSMVMSNQDKLIFLASVLPSLGVAGGLLRVLGCSEEVTLAVIIPLFLIAFFAWHVMAIRKTALLSSREMWMVREERLVQRREELVAAQQEALRELRLRQKAEQEQMMWQQASKEQMSLMMDRHRQEFEDLLRRDIA